MEIRHVDTCLPCYVQDHCNGLGETLLGVPVNGGTRMWEVRDMIRDEWRNHSSEDSEHVTDSDFESALAEAFADVVKRRGGMLRTFDSSLESAGEDDTGESCYAWFRVSWEVPREVRASINARRREDAKNNAAAAACEAEERALWIAAGASDRDVSNAGTKARQAWWGVWIDARNAARMVGG